MTQPTSNDWSILNRKGVTKDNLSVGGSLYLSGTQITALPDNLSVSGFLDLSGTQITALPDNLSVGGSLYLSGTQITALPDNLSVGGFLDLSGTQITAHGNLNGNPILSKEDASPYIQEVAKHALKNGNLDMSVVHNDCGTSHCIAGWAQVLWPEKVRQGRELVDAVNLLGVEAASHFFDNDADGRLFLEQNI